MYAKSKAVTLYRYRFYNHSHAFHFPTKYLINKPHTDPLQPYNKATNSDETTLCV